MLTIVRKFRIWGLRGAFNYLIGRIQQWRWHRYFAANARRFPYEQSEKGITVIGNLSSKGSLNKTLRDFCFSLKDAGIPFQTLDTGRKEIPPEDIDAILTPSEEFKIRRYSHVVEMINSPLQAGIVDHIARIGFWEFESGFLEAFPTYLEREGDVIGMSDFNVKYFEKIFAGRRTVFKILYPLRLEIDSVLPKSDCRKKFGFADNDFIVFYNFSYSSGYGRKNPEAAVRAFAKAFQHDQNAKLVFKTFKLSLKDDRSKQLKDLARELGVEDRLVLISDYLSQRDVFNLTNACDVYLSLHRAEGFGIGIAEAMSLGKAVVVTGYSSVTEFCNSENSVLIPYKLVAMDHPDTAIYISAEHWADPDINQAVASLRQLKTDKDYCEALGQRGRASMLKQFSNVNFRSSVASYIQ